MQLHSEAGNKQALTASGVYPLEFGYQLAILMPPRSDRPPESEFDASAPGYSGRDHLGSMDDFLKGRVNTWWRHL